MTWQILEGDCRNVLATMEPESVQCVVTSPPYWGLRDYGTAAWEGGDAECDHLRAQGGSGRPEDGANLGNSNGRMPTGQQCHRCGARRIDSQLGLEPTPEEYVATMVDVFQEIRRVLRDDGTVWLNMGDSYGSGTTADRNPTSTEGPEVPASWSGRSQPQRNGLKPKDLVGIPWRLAFALQADGWYLRSDIIWAKPNPMPESVTDRPTKSHEYVFLLTKSARYFYDQDAASEPSLHAGREIRYDGDEESVIRGLTDTRFRTRVTSDRTVTARWPQPGTFAPSGISQPNHSPKPTLPRSRRLWSSPA